MIEHEFIKGWLHMCHEGEDGQRHRSVRRPGSDLADLPADIQMQASELWTPAFIAEIELSLLARDLEPTSEEQARQARKAEFPDLYPDQFWFGLRAAGYEDDVRAWVAGLRDTDPTTWAWASAKLEFATYFERDHPLVENFRAAIGMPETELDALWSYAANG